PMLPLLFKNIFVLNSDSMIHAGSPVPIGLLAQCYSNCLPYRIHYHPLAYMHPYTYLGDTHTHTYTHTHTIISTHTHSPPRHISDTHTHTHTHTHRHTHTHTHTHTHAE